MSLVQERERRPNAGSRMRALLDEELDMEELFEYRDSDEEDEEFPGQAVEEEEDLVDSDFDIDSSEGEQEHIEEGRAMDDEIKRAERKEARRAKIHIASSAATSRDTIPTERRKRKERATTTEFEDEHRKRYSSRKNTVLNRLHVEDQLREHEKRKAKLPKRDRPVVSKMTQEERLAEAAITEELNRDSLLEWQQMEAERREKAKKKDKKRIIGPFVRYHSFMEDHGPIVQTANPAQATEQQAESGKAEEQQQPKEQTIEATQNKEQQAIEQQLEEQQPTEQQPTEQPLEQQPTEQQPTEPQTIEQQPVEKKSKEQQPTEQQPAEAQPTEAQPTEAQPTEAQSTEQQSTEQQSTEQQSTEQQPIEEQPQNGPSTQLDQQPAETSVQSNTEPMDMTDGIEGDWQISKNDLMGRNLVSFMDNTILDGDPSLEAQDYIDADGTEKDLDNVDLIDQLSDWLVKSPKPNRPVVCPITGLVARYKDPATGVPYANLTAYRMIKACLHHEMRWASTAGIYLGYIPSAKGVPEGWDDAI